MSRLSPQARRLSALALLVTLIVALWGLAVVPYATALDEADRAIAGSHELLTRSLRVAAERPALRAARARLQAELESGSGFLEGDSLELIAAGLQDRVSQLVGRQEGALDSLQTLPFQTEAGFRKVAVRASMTLDTPALQRILHALEAAQPVLLIDNLEISAAALGTAGRARGAERLTVRFDVFGFVRGEPA